MPRKSKAKAKPKPTTDTSYTPFKPGAVVEISSNDVGFRGSWYLCTVIRGPTARNPSKCLIQYTHLFENDEGTKLLKETVDLYQLRPVAPREKEREFKLGEEVDAHHNDGWWEGVITKVEGSQFAVYFRNSKEQIKFGAEDLRLHREWIKGEWKPPLEDDTQSEKVPTYSQPEEEPDKISETEEEPDKLSEKEEEPDKVSETEEEPDKLSEKEEEPDKLSEKKEEPDKLSEKAEEPDKLSEKEEEPDKIATEEQFAKGTLVEVSSDEDGFQGAWFAATIVESTGKDKYLIEYQSLTTEDDKEFLKEEVDTKHIRPSPPETLVVDRFVRLDEVDALYNDGWWVGVISKVHCESKYLVYFKATGEELMFDHADLRLHQDWINGKWVAASLGLRP